MTGISRQRPKELMQLLRSNAFDAAIEQTYRIDPEEWEEFLHVLRFSSGLGNIEFTYFREPDPYFPKGDKALVFHGANIQLSVEYPAQEDVYDVQHRLADALRQIQPEKEEYAVYVSSLFEDLLTSTPEVVYVFKQVANERSLRSYAKITLKPAEQF